MPPVRRFTERLWDRMEEILVETIPLAAELKEAQARADALEADENADPGEVMDAHLKRWQIEAEKNKVGAIGRGISEALAMMLHPAMADDATVRKHAIHRHKALVAGEPIETPGYSIGREPAEPEKLATTKHASVDDTQQLSKSAPIDMGKLAKTAAPRKNAPVPAPTPEEVIEAEKASPKVQDGSDEDNPLTVKPLKIPEGTVREAPPSSYPRDKDYDSSKPFKPKMSVEEALRRAAERAKERRDSHPPQAPDRPSNNNVEETPDEIAAQLQALEEA